MNATLAKHQFRVGDSVVVRGWPPSAAMAVADTSDPAMLRLQLPSGACIKVGRLACERLNPAAQEQTARVKIG